MTMEEKTQFEFTPQELEFFEAHLKLSTDKIKKLADERHPFYIAAHHWGRAQQSVLQKIRTKALYRYMMNGRTYL